MPPRPAPLDRYSLKQRPQPRSRRARCEEVDCEAHIHGWRTTLAITDRARLAAVENSGRHFTRTLRPGFVDFLFPAGQQCFAEHWVDKLQLFIARGANTTPELWTEQFGENQQKLAEIHSRG